VEREGRSSRDLKAESQSAVTARLRLAIGANYTIERELGQGGMATVHLARDLRHQRLVALKVLDPALGAVLGASRFRREITLAAQLQHPHIVAVFDSGETANDDLWFTMPYIPGESLRARLVRERRLSLPVVQVLARQVAAALDYAHRHGVVHRDIKPENVLLTEDGDALVADFGIACDVAHPSEGRLTATGLSLGTPGYMSPEQIAGERSIDGRADQYALGCLVYEALTGHPPFEGPTAQAVIVKHAAAPVPLLRAERPSLPASVEAAVARAMAKAPDERFSSVGAFAESLGVEGSATPDALTSRPVSDVAIGASPIGAVRVSWLIGGLALLLLLGGGTWWLRGRTSPAAAVPAFDPERVAVTAFHNRSGDPALAPVVREAEESVFQGIAQFPEVDLVPASVVRATERRLAGGGTTDASNSEPRDVTLLGAKLGAGVIVGGSVARGNGDSVVVQATLTDGRTGKLYSAVNPIAVPRSEVATAITSVRERVRGGIAVLRDFGRDALTGREPPRYAAVWETNASNASRDPTEEMQHYRKAMQADSAFLLARIFAATFYRTTGRAAGAGPGSGDSAFRSLGALQSQMTPYESAQLAVSQARIRGDHQAGIDAILRAVAFDSSTRLVQQLRVALVDANRLRDFLTLDRVWFANLPPRLQRNSTSPNFWILRTNANHLLGNHAEELAAARAARRQRPSGLTELAYEAVALAAMDSLAVVESRMAEALALPMDRSDGSGECGCGTAGGVMYVVASELEVHGHSAAAMSLNERALAWYRARNPGIPASQRLSMIATILKALERWDEVVPVVDSIVAIDGAKASSNPVAQSSLTARNGLVAAHLGDRRRAELALDSLTRSADALGSATAKWGSAIVLFGAAQVEAALGRRDEAVSRLRVALPAIGNRTFWRAMHRSPDFRALRGYPPFEALTGAR